jgi:hypothetical protein
MALSLAVEAALAADEVRRAPIGPGPRRHDHWVGIGFQGQRRTRTISLGSGLSCFADHSICSSETIWLVRECPLQTVSTRGIGHATGTPALAAGR